MTRKWRIIKRGDKEILEEVEEKEYMKEKGSVKKIRENGRERV